MAGQAKKSHGFLGESLGHGGGCHRKVEAPKYPKLKNYLIGRTSGVDPNKYIYIHIIYIDIHIIYIYI